MVFGRMWSKRIKKTSRPPRLESETAAHMMEEWLEVPSFPGYSVSSYGRVRNEDSGRYMTLLQNQQGIIHVGLTRNRVQYKRSVTILVASSFVPRPREEAYDTPINLDGDRTNNRFYNLIWRPRWFAVKYFQQFRNNQRGLDVPIEDIDTGEKFRTSWDAATKYGLIDKEIVLGILNHTPVWPTRQRFRVI